MKQEREKKEQLSNLQFKDFEDNHSLSLLLLSTTQMSYFLAYVSM